MDHRGNSEIDIDFQQLNKPLMIIYGSRSSHVKSIQLDNEACPHCSTHGSVTMSTFTRYAHVFWIPFFSLGRFSVSHCQHCKQTLTVKEMPAQIRAYHLRNLAETRLPLWQFAGVALLSVGIGFSVFANNLDKEVQAERVKSPMAGDVYELKTNEGAYTTFRIVNVKMDTIAVHLNNYEVKTVSGINKLDKDENYSDSTYLIPVSTLQEMFTAGEIVDINRR